jgi:hypothetical protein
MKSAFMKAGYSANEIIVDNTNIISKQTAKLAAIPDYGKTDPRFPGALKVKMRYKARIKLANDCMIKAKAQIKLLPLSVEWDRIAVNSEMAPSLNQILPKIWELEKKLREGKNIYLYSRDGHGRVGMMGAILLGRLYGLHSYEVIFNRYFKQLLLLHYYHFQAVYRIQACHDSAKRELNRKIPITCPQLPIQVY